MRQPRQLCAGVLEELTDPSARHEDRRQVRLRSTAHRPRHAGRRRHFRNGQGQGSGRQAAARDLRVRREPPQLRVRDHGPGRRLPHHRPHDGQVPDVLRALPQPRERPVAAALGVRAHRSHRVRLRRLAPAGRHRHGRGQGRARQSRLRHLRRVAGQAALRRRTEPRRRHVLGERAAERFVPDLVQRRLRQRGQLCAAVLPRREQHRGRRPDRAHGRADERRAQRHDAAGRDDHRQCHGRAGKPGQRRVHHLHAGW